MIFLPPRRFRTARRIAISVLPMPVGRRSTLNGAVSVRLGRKPGERVGVEQIVDRLVDHLGGPLPGLGDGRQDRARPADPRSRP